MAPKRRRADHRLSEYHAKRDLRRSGEPDGGARGTARTARGAGQRRGRRPRFVVQQHEARTEHYDFRLEVEGVLKSWAVPKGPPADPHEKRLAVATEDHPMEYADFEGVIAPGEYGAGEVIVWDRGWYVNRSHDKAGRPVDAAAAISDGHVSFDLRGKKLRGRYALTRIRGRGKNSWLLVRSADEPGARGTAGQPDDRSVKSGRTIADLAAERSQ